VHSFQPIIPVADSSTAAATTQSKFKSRNNHNKPTTTTIAEYSTSRLKLHINNSRFFVSIFNKEHFRRRHASSVDQGADRVESAASTRLRRAGDGASVSPSKMLFVEDAEESRAILLSPQTSHQQP